MTPPIQQSITINRPPPVVWDMLTNPNLMKQWMAEPEMKIDIITDWKIGGPIEIRGFHHTNFENKGTVLKFEPNHVVAYSHLSSLSQLPDKPGNYTIIEFRLKHQEDVTLLTLILSNFPTETIQKHIDFYWTSTMTLLKKFVER